MHMVNTINPALGVVLIVIACLILDILNILFGKEIKNRIRVRKFIRKFEKLRKKFVKAFVHFDFDNLDPEKASDDEVCNAIIFIRDTYSTAWEIKNFMEENADMRDLVCRYYDFPWDTFLDASTEVATKGVEFFEELYRGYINMPNASGKDDDNG